MIIFGWRSLTSFKSMEPFHCPVCKSPQTRAVARTRTWFTLFFVPVFPVSGTTSQVLCGGCGSVLNLAGAPGSAASVPPVVHQPEQLAGQPAGQRAGYPVGVQSLGAVQPTSPAALPSTSTWAILSLIAGIISPVLIIACFLSLFTSIFSVIAGHLAIHSIRQGAGRLEGRGVAIAGLILGYLSLALTFAAILFVVIRWPSAPSDGLTVAERSANAQSPSERLRVAEMDVMSYSSGKVGMGNSAEAEGIATEFAVAMKDLDEKLFTSNRKRVLELTQGEFLTHCELQPGSCALIVHVPAYRDYTDDAREAVAEIAWATALAKTAEVLQPGDQLAVALRGTLRYGDILLGTVSEEEEASDERRNGKSQDLLSFFQLPPNDPLNDPLSEPSSDTSPSNATPSRAPASSGSASDLAMVPPGKSKRNESSEAYSGTSAPATASSAATLPDMEPPVAAAEPKESEARSATPSRADRRRSERTLPPEPSRAAKPPAPKFENKIPTSLTLETAAEGWNVTALAFVNDDKWLAIGRMDATLSIVDSTDGVKLYQSERLDELGQIVSLAGSQDKKHLIAGGSNGATVVFDLKERGELGAPRSLYRHAREAKCVVSSPRHAFMISGGKDGTLAWHPYDPRPDTTRVLQSLSKQVQAIHLPEQGAEAMATDGKQLLRFSLRDGKVVSTLPLGNSYPQAAAFHQAGTELAISYGGQVDEFDTSTGALRKSYKGAASGVLWSVAFHPTEPWLLTGGSGVLIVWDRDTAEPIAELDMGSPLYVQTFRLSASANHVAAVPAAAGQGVKIFKLIP